MNQLLFFMETNKFLTAILFIAPIDFCVDIIINRRAVAVNKRSPSFDFSGYLQKLPVRKLSKSIDGVSQVWLLIPELRKLIQACILQVTEY